MFAHKRKGAGILGFSKTQFNILAHFFCMLIFFILPYSYCIIGNTDMTLFFDGILLSDFSNDYTNIKLFSRLEFEVYCFR